jgi:hypothetical protein
VSVFAREAGRLRELEAAGFASQADIKENAWSQVLMQRSDQPAAVSGALPAGFAIRPLAGQQEVEGYVECHRAAFQSDSMRTG